MKFKITKEKLLKMIKKVLREEELKSGIKQVGRIHKTHKKDKIRNNTVKDWED